MKKYTIEQFFDLLEKFNHENKYISGLSLSPKEREVNDLRQSGLTMPQMVDVLQVSRNRIWEIDRKIKSKVEKQRQFIDFIKEYGHSNN